MKMQNVSSLLYSCASILFPVIAKNLNPVLFSAHFEQAGIAVIEQLNDLDSKFEIKFVLNNNGKF